MARRCHELTARRVDKHWDDTSLPELGSIFLNASVVSTDDIGMWDTSPPRPDSYSLETFADILRPRLAGLQEALSKERFEATLNRAVKQVAKDKAEHKKRWAQHRNQ